MLKFFMLYVFVRSIFSVPVFVVVSHQNLITCHIAIT